MLESLLSLGRALPEWQHGHQHAWADYSTSQQLGPVAPLLGQTS